MSDSPSVIDNAPSVEPTAAETTATPQADAADEHTTTDAARILAQNQPQMMRAMTTTNPTPQNCQRAFKTHRQTDASALRTGSTHPRTGSEDFRKRAQSAGIATRSRPVAV